MDWAGCHLLAWLGAKHEVGGLSLSRPVSLELLVLEMSAQGSGTTGIPSVLGPLGEQVACEAKIIQRLRRKPNFL